MDNSATPETLFPEAESPESDADPSQSVTNAKTAKTAKGRVSVDKKLVAQRNREAKRLAAIAEAAGPTVTYPAAVNRAGEITEITIGEAAAVVRQIMAERGELVVDVETSGYSVGHKLHELRLIQLGHAQLAVVFDARKQEHRAVCAGLLTEAPKLRAHSATADLIPMALRAILDIESGWDKMHDTVNPAKLINPGQSDSDPSLKKLSPILLGAHAVSPGADARRRALFGAGKWLLSPDNQTPPSKNGWYQVDPCCATMAVYAASDVLDTGAVAEQLDAMAAQQGITDDLTDRERWAQRMTARITHRGLCIDAEHVRALTEYHTTERAEASVEVRAFGVDNPGSNDQVAAVALSLGATLPSTKTGKASVTKDTLAPLRDAEGDLGQFVRSVLRFRGHDKSLSTYCLPYLEMCEHGDGRFRPTIYTLGTDTGRMSSVRPNAQNLPKVGGIRRMITANPGKVLISADFAGVEIRGAAALSQDQNLIRFIADEDAAKASGDDKAQVGLHWLIAKQVWGENATKAHRYIAKRIVFGRWYGGGVETLAAQAGVSQELTAAACRTLDELAPDLAQWSDMLRKAVRAGHLRFPSYSGRIIHFVPTEPHKAPNYAIQGTCRELLVDALLRWRDTRWGNATLIPVHDELIVEVPAEDAQEATAELVRCMEGELYGVPILAEASEPSFFWQDAA